MADSYASNTTHCNTSNTTHCYTSDKITCQNNDLKKKKNLLFMLRPCNTPVFGGYGGLTSLKRLVPFGKKTKKSHVLDTKEL